MSRFILVLLSAEFLIYRLKAINTRLCGRFTKPTSVSGPKRLRKQTTSLFRVPHLLNSFCKQFEKINSVLDSSISMYLAGLYISLFILPYFCVFVESELSIRLGFCAPAMVLYMLCFSFSICNDRLRRQVQSICKFTSFSEPPSVPSSTNFLGSSLSLSRSKR